MTPFLLGLGKASWLQIATASAAGTSVFLLLNLLRGWAMRLRRRGGGMATWYTILGREQ